MRYGSVETAPRKINKKKKYEEKLNVLDICVSVTIFMFGPSYISCVIYNISCKYREKGIIACDSGMLSVACVSFNDIWPHECIKL